MIRRYCDVCECEMEQGEPAITLKTYPASLLIGSQIKISISLTVSGGDVCKACLASKLEEWIRDIRKGGGFEP